MTTRQSSARREQVRGAYAVLGDPRLRAEYDRGQVVGVGAGHYFHTAVPPMSGRQRRPRSRTPSSGHQRWGARTIRMPTFEARARTRWRPLLLLTALAAVVSTAITVQARSDLSAPGLAGPAHRAVPTSAPAAAHLGEASPYVPTGACFTPDESLEIDPAEPVSCDGPHRFEVIKTVDLLRLLGPVDGASKAQVNAAAHGVCEAEFASFTGLAGPVEDMWLTSLTTTGGPRPRPPGSP